MGGNWWFRFSVILGVLAVAIYVLIPTMLAESATDRLAAQVESVDGDGSAETLEDDTPGWWPDTRINLGLDLQGGIDLTLSVDVEEAVLSAIGRDVQTVEDLLERNGVTVNEVRRARTGTALEVDLANETDLSELKSNMQERMRAYRYKQPRTTDDGVTWHVWEMLEESQREIGTNSVEQALEGLRNRVDATGVKEPAILRKGEDINVQLPGIDNLQQAISVIGTTAMLEFFLVDEEADENDLQRAILAAEGVLEPEVFADDESLNNWLLDEGRISSGQRVLWEYLETTDEAGKETKERSIPYILKDQVILTGDDINDASVQWNQMGDAYVAMEFKPAGGRKFGDITGDNVGKRFAIVLDREVRSAPVIREKIAGGRASIEMGAGDPYEIQQDSTILSLVLRTGALPAPVQIGEVRQVGSQLGADSIAAGVRATLVGGSLVIVFMFIYYRSLGAVANAALCLNVFAILALLASLGATLTLPGIAGIALTVGMAVDANIIIFERIREELRLGKTARSAVDSGFDNALSAVVDANITTAIAGIVLYSYGTGPIKGFAVTLLVGIATTLFTAIFVSRTLMDLLVRRSSARLSL
ncbi:MAG: protein translocase subunit SecD [Myxococcota bacterium]|nr:protein translocase subunit SecD [Myxococcota bacterium]